MNGKPTYEELESRIKALEDLLKQGGVASGSFSEKEARYRMIIDNAGQAVIVAQDGRIVFSNPMASTVTGYPKEELASRPFVDFIHPEDRELVLDRHLRRSRGEEVPGSYRFRVIRKEGQVVWVEITAAALEWDGRPATINFLSDISSRIEAEESLAKRDRLLESVARSVCFLVTESDLDKAMQYALKELGEAVEADRAYVFFNRKDESDGRLFMSQRWEWTNGKVTSEIGNPILQNLPYDSLTPELMENFRENKAFSKIVEELDPYSRGILESQGIKSVLQVPIYVQGEMWGFIGFDDCEEKRQWLDSEKAILKIAAETLGGAISRLRMEDGLKRSEEQFRSLSKMLRLMCDDVPDMIWAKDLSKRYIFANRAVCRDLLNARDTAEPIGQTDMFFAERERSSHPENPEWHTFGEICADSDHIVMKSGNAGRFEEFGNVKGKFLVLDVHKAPFIDEAGNMVGTVGCARDVTAEREITARYRMLTEKMQDIAWILDMELKTVYVSPSIKNVLGFTPEDRMAQRLDEQVTPESLAKAREILSMEMAREAAGEADLERSVTLVMEYYHKDGSTRWLENVITGLRNERGVLTGLYGISRDITERRRREEDDARNTARRQREAALVAAVAGDPNLADGNIENLAVQVTEAASQAIGVERVGIWMFDEKMTKLVCLDNYSASLRAHSCGEVLNESEFREEFEALKRSKYVDASDAMRDPRTAGYGEGYLKRHGIVSMLDAVVRSGGRSLGVICFEHKGRIRTWQDDEISFACQLADQIAIAISNRGRRRHSGKARRGIVISWRTPMRPSLSYRTEWSNSSMPTR